MPEVPAPPKSIGRRRAEVLCITGIAVKSIFALVLLFLSPSLIGTHPVLLEALRGSTEALASGGAFARVGQASLLLAILAPLPTLLFITPFYWWAGKLWGPKAAEVLSGGHPSAKRWAQRSGRHLERYGSYAVLIAPIIPIPSAFIYAAAGWTGMTFRRFMVFDTLGMLAWIGLIVGLGYAIGHPAVHVAKEISHYGLEVTLGLVVVFVVWSTVKASRAERLAQQAEAAGDHGTEPPAP